MHGISAQTIKAIDEKGTFHPINWSLSGNDIHNNNTGNVGIGTNVPNNTLEITQGTNGNSGLRLTNLTSASLLGTDANGDIITANPALGTIATSSYLGYDTGGNLVLGSVADTGTFWSLNGNSNATSAHFLGTTNDIRFSIVSNNTSMLEVGRRQTLGLFDGSSTGLFPYDQPNASVAYIRGTAGASALQFESSSALFYKPIFFTDGDGNFMMRGSSAQTDFFELGSAGALNDGSLIFSIGDDGNEPMIFRKFNYTTQTYVEMLRMQGTGLNDNVRTGINVNGNIPNSTLQVNGSTSYAITTTTANLVLTEDHHTIVLGGNHTLTLPNANTCQGRIYIIKNPTDNATIISGYTNLNGTSVSTVNDNTVLWLQSDGTNWQQISEGNKGYEKIVIWAEERTQIGNGGTQEWSFGHSDNGFIGIPLPEDWEAYAVSCHVDNTVNAFGSVTIAVGDIPANNTFTELFRFTASGGSNDNLVFHQLLASTVNINAGTTLSFRTINNNQDLEGARVAVWLRRKP